MGLLRLPCKDHLGSIRITLDQNNEITNGQDYLPLGSIFREYNIASTNEKYDFTACPPQPKRRREKERDTETGLNYFGARYYDSDLGRWTSVDPLAHLYHGHSPYNYALNNPLVNIDPDGNSVWEKIKNFVTKGDWRDDTIQENFEQKDWENATPQVAQKAGIDVDKVKVVYDSKDPGSYFQTSSNGKDITVKTTKNGFEKFNESNIDNSISSMEHESSHVDDGATKIQEAGKDPKTRINSELKAIDFQKSISTWPKTTKTYKEKIQRYKENWLRAKKVGERKK